MMVKRILVGLGDLAHARSAAAVAVGLAKSHQAELTGVTLFDPDRLDDSGPVPLGGGSYASELKTARLESAREVIAAASQAFVERCLAADVPHKVVHETGDPLERIAAHARYHDLVICGLHGLFQHGVIPEPADQMAKIVQAGVRPLVAVSADERPIKRVLIAYSGSMESAKTMKRLVQLGLWREATMQIVTFQTDAEIGAQLLADAASYFRAHGLQPATECINAPPQEHLLGYAAQWGADMIVMGNSAKNLLVRRIFGETALSVMRNANVPLFLAQ